MERISIYENKKFESILLPKSYPDTGSMQELSGEDLRDANTTPTQTEGNQQNKRSIFTSTSKELLASAERDEFCKLLEKFESTVHSFITEFIESQLYDQTQAAIPKNYNLKLRVKLMNHLLQRFEPPVRKILQEEVLAATCHIICNQRRVGDNSDNEARAGKCEPSRAELMYILGNTTFRKFRNFTAKLKHNFLAKINVYKSEILVNNHQQFELNGVIGEDEDYCQQQPFRPPSPRVNPDQHYEHVLHQILRPQCCGANDPGIHNVRVYSEFPPTSVQKQLLQGTLQYKEFPPCYLNNERKPKSRVDELRCQGCLGPGVQMTTAERKVLECKIASHLKSLRCATQVKLEAFGNPSPYRKMLIEEVATFQSFEDSMLNYTLIHAQGKLGDDLRQSQDQRGCSKDARRSRGSFEQERCPRFPTDRRRRNKPYRELRSRGYTSLSGRAAQDPTRGGRRKHGSRKGVRSAEAQTGTNPRTLRIDSGKGDAKGSNSRQLRRGTKYPQRWSKKSDDESSNGTTAGSSTKESERQGKKTATKASMIKSTNDPRGNNSNGKWGPSRANFRSIGVSPDATNGSKGKSNNRKQGGPWDGKDTTIDPNNNNSKTKRQNAGTGVSPDRKNNRSKTNKGVGDGAEEVTSRSNKAFGGNVEEYGRSKRDRASGGDEFTSRSKKNSKGTGNDDNRNSKSKGVGSNTEDSNFESSRSRKSKGVGNGSIENRGSKGGRGIGVGSDRVSNGSRRSTNTKGVGNDDSTLDDPRSRRSKGSSYRGAGGSLDDSRSRKSKGVGSDPLPNDKNPSSRRSTGRDYDKASLNGKKGQSSGKRKSSTTSMNGSFRSRASIKKLREGAADGRDQNKRNHSTGSSTSPFKRNRSSKSNLDPRRRRGSQKNVSSRGAGDRSGRTPSGTRQLAAFYSSSHNNGGRKPLYDKTKTENGRNKSRNNERGRAPGFLPQVNNNKSTNPGLNTNKSGYANLRGGKSPTDKTRLPRLNRTQNDGLGLKLPFGYANRTTKQPKVRGSSADHTLRWKRHDGKAGENRETRVIPRTTFGSLVPIGKEKLPRKFSGWLDLVRRQSESEQSERCSDGPIDVSTMTTSYTTHRPAPAPNIPNGNDRNNFSSESTIILGNMGMGNFRRPSSQHVHKKQSDAGKQQDETPIDLNRPQENFFWVPLGRYSWEMRNIKVWKSQTTINARDSLGSKQYMGIFPDIKINQTNNNNNTKKKKSLSSSSNRLYDVVGAGEKSPPDSEICTSCLLDYSFCQCW